MRELFKKHQWLGVLAAVLFGGIVLMLAYYFVSLEYVVNLGNYVFLIWFETIGICLYVFFMAWLLVKSIRKRKHGTFWQETKSFLIVIFTGFILFAGIAFVWDKLIRLSDGISILEVQSICGFYVDTAGRGPDQHKLRVINTSGASDTITVTKGAYDYFRQRYSSGCVKPEEVILYEDVFNLVVDIAHK